MFLRIEPIVKSKVSDTEFNETKTAGTFVMDVSISIKVIDTEFEETVATSSIYDAIIKSYEKRKLNVASALAIYLKNQPNAIGLFRKHPTFAKYSNDIEKLLLLM